MRSAADSDEVGWPEPAAVEQRIESARSWRASSVYRSVRAGAWLAVAMELPYACRDRVRNEERTMEIGIYGLGRMGGNMATRLARGGHHVVVSNRSRGPVDEAVQHGAVAAYSIADMVSALKPPRVLWSMVPAGAVTDEALEEFAKHASTGDIFVDGGNSNFHDSQRRATQYAARGFRYLDVGVSGGVWGLKVGYCMMVGGPADAVSTVA